ncbi:hypothetical protein ACVBGC_32250 [Burkholderia stagnalis]
MISEIIVRHHAPGLWRSADKLAELIAARTHFAVSMVDHSQLRLADFGRRSVRGVVSIDRHLAARFDVPYVRVSRTFRPDGSVAGRVCRRHGSVPARPHVIDTDICTGATMEAAGNLLGYSAFSAPLRLMPHQELVDIEDLVFNTSILTGGGMSSYLDNPAFFATRTSLPASLFDRVAAALR